MWKNRSAAWKLQQQQYNGPLTLFTINQSINQLNDLSASNLVQRYAPFLRTRGQCGVRSRDPIFKFWYPLVTFERINLSASNLVQRWKADPPYVWTVKRPLNGRGRGPNFFKISGPVTFFLKNRAICFKFGVQIENGPFLRTDHKLSWVDGSRLVFAWHLQNSKHKSQALLTTIKQQT